MTCVTRSPPRPRIVHWLSCQETDSTPGIASKRCAADASVVSSTTVCVRAVLPHETRRRADVDDAAAFDDGDAVAEALGLLHEMRGQQHGLAARANLAHQIPDGAPGLGIEAGRQLVEQHDVGIVNERERDEEPLLLPARERHEPGLPLVGETETLEQGVSIHGMRIERRPQVNRFATLIRFWSCACCSCTPTFCCSVRASRIGSSDSTEIDPRSGTPQPFDALHRRRLAGAIRTDETEDLALLDVERHIVDGDGLAVGLCGFPRRG